MYSTRCSSQILTEIFSKNIHTFNENLSNGIQVVPCGPTDGRTGRRTEAETDMTKPIVAFRNFAKPALKGEVNRANKRICTTRTTTLECQGLCLLEDRATE